MEIAEISVDLLRNADWNPNLMDGQMSARLSESVVSFGLVENLVVRPLADGTYEVLSGNQRLQVAQTLGLTIVPCVIVDLDDARARLLAQALNMIQGDDDLGLKADLVRNMLETIPEQEILKVLPESAESLRDLASLGETDLARHLVAWNKAEAAKLKHMTFQLTNDQQVTVKDALDWALTVASIETENPNRNGNALYLLSKSYLERKGDQQ